MAFPDPQRCRWFEAHAAGIVARCRRTVTDMPGGAGPPLDVYVPGGDDKYPSFWIRDAVMQCRSGLVGRAGMHALLRLILRHQHGPEPRALAHGLRITPWAIPDHINLPGLGDPQAQPPGAVFYPGTYSPGDDQGEGAFGLRPADDDLYETVELTRLVCAGVTAEAAAETLAEPVAGLRVIDRLDRGMQALATDPATGLCRNEAQDWAAANFHDGVQTLGAVALTSVLRFRAARDLADLFRLIENPGQAEHYERLAEQLRRSVGQVLLRPDGWLMAGTVQNRVPDVWATAMAIYEGLLDGDRAARSCRALLESYRDGSVAVNGYLRHVPVWGDAFPGRSVWEHPDKPGPYGTYQNGGYWPQPVGWYVFALAQVDRAVAVALAREFIDHTRQHAAQGAPFEWINPDLPDFAVPARGRWYGPSAALPLEAFRKLE